MRQPIKRLISLVGELDRWQRMYRLADDDGVSERAKALLLQLVERLTSREAGGNPGPPDIMS